MILPLFLMGLGKKISYVPYMKLNVFLCFFVADSVFQVTRHSRSSRKELIRSILGLEMKQVSECH